MDLFISRFITPLASWQRSIDKIIDKLKLIVEIQRASLPFQPCLFARGSPEDWCLGVRFVVLLYAMMTVGVFVSSASNNPSYSLHPNSTDTRLTHACTPPPLWSRLLSLGLPIVFSLSLFLSFAIRWPPHKRCDVRTTTSRWVCALMFLHIVAVVYTRPVCQYVEDTEPTSRSYDDETARKRKPWTPLGNPPSSASSSSSSSWRKVHAISKSSTMLRDRYRLAFTSRRDTFN